MAVTTPRWESLFAARTRADVGDGIAQVLAFLGMPGLISFAGGFPDPLTFPRERAAALLEEFASGGEVSAFQYAPTRGLAGPLDALARRIESQQGRRPDQDELLIMSGAIEALDLIGKTFLDRKHGFFRWVCRDADYELVDQMRTASDDVEVPKRDRVERTGIDRDFHLQ